MKFARYLDENIVPEWRKVYIQYRGLKKLIKRVAEHREARLRYQAELGLAPTHSSSTAVAPSTPTADPFLRRRSLAAHSSQLDHEAQHALASSSGYLSRNDYGGTNPPAPHSPLPPLPVVTLDGTGLRLSSDSLPINEPASPSPSQKPSKANDIEVQGAQHHPTHAIDRVHARTQHHGGPSVDTTFSTQTSPHEQATSSFDDPPASPAASASDDPPTSPTSSRPLRSSTVVRYDDSVSPASGSTPVTAHASRKPNSYSASTKRQRLARNASSSRFSNRSYKEGPPSSLQELISTQFDHDEAKFFSACDAELERIVAFYETQEQQAANKYAQLARQLKELADHRREYRAKYNISDHDRTSAGARRSRFSQLFTNLPGSKLIGADEVLQRIKAIPALTTSKSRDPRQQRSATASSRFSSERNLAKQRNDSSDEDAGGRRRAQALAQLHATLKDGDEEADQAIRDANRAAAMSHDPEAYAAARKKLKAAVLEYYKFLDTLTNYKILNRTGFAKVMKKFSKTVGVQCTELYYQDKVAPTILVTSDRVEQLRKATEDIYTAYFEHGNRKQALNRLRAREDHTTHHYSVFRSGFYLGISLCATIAGLIEAMKPHTQQTIPQWSGLLRVYGAEFIPTLFALLFGLNLAWWHAVRINTVFIFEWDVRTTMDHRQFFEIPALLMLLLSCCFWVSFINPFPAAIAPTTWPTVWLVIALVLLLNPLPILLPASRMWFVKSLARVFTAGWKRVEFRDFFLGDELNSVAWSISTLWYFGCEWHHHWAYPQRCYPNDTFWTAALLSVPAWLRLGQCIRRWVDSDYRTHLHLVNAGKYSSAVVYNFIYISYRRHGSPSGGTHKALWILFGIVYSLWHIAWDLIMDWSLLKPRAKYFLLRNEISFPQPVYYVFMVVDTIGRSAWVTYLIPGSASVTLRSFLAALAEMLRRVCWNNLRVENEQIGNTDSFKIMRDLPLPYRQKLIDEADEGTDDDRVHKTGIFANVKLASLRSKKAQPSAAAHSAPHEHRLHNLIDDQRNKASEQETLAQTGTAEGRTNSLIQTLRNKLVPDRALQNGQRLDASAATKGRSGRDYEPRRGEGEIGLEDVSVDSDDEDDDQDGQGAHASDSTDGSKSYSNRRPGLPQTPPRARPKGSGVSVETSDVQTEVKRDVQSLQ